MLLSKLTKEFETIEVDVDETPGINESPSEYVLRISLEKAMQARQKLSSSIPVLSADTEVICNNIILGKPSTHAEAIDMLMSLSNREHAVYTAVVLLIETPNQLLNISRVRFRNIDKIECEQYVKKFLPLDKAGAYGIQDQAAGFIKRFEGSYSGVMGLPLPDTRRLLSLATIKLL
ncbi:MAG: septum formation protein [Gammaproteobacteria bacterium]|jgi:septum formation protein